MAKQVTYHVEVKASSMEKINAENVRQSSTGDYEFYTTTAGGGKHVVAAVPKENVLFIVERGDKAS